MGNSMRLRLKIEEFEYVLEYLAAENSSKKYGNYINDLLIYKNLNSFNY